MSSITIKPRLVFLTIACCCFASSSNANPNLTSITDGSMGAKVTLSGNFEVPQSLGTTVGNNLFHSFSSFNIDAGKTATFTGSDSLQNVFTRVTGGDKSQLDGTLKSTIGHADFYFINPNGVVFGKDSQLDVPASFYVSTAEQLQFHDGAVLNTSLLNHSSLTAAKPEAYGFLTDRSNEIQFLGNGSKTQDDNYYYHWTGTNLYLNPNKTFEIVAGFIDINETRLKSESGNFYLIAQNHAGIVPLNAPSNNATGNINITGSWLDARGVDDNNNALGEELGVAVLHASNINMDSSLLYETNTSNHNAKLGEGIDIIATNLQLTDSEIHTEAEKNGGDAGQIKVVVDNLNLNNSTINSSAYLGDGNAGTVTIQVAKDLDISNGGYIGGITWSEGNAGNIVVTANNITIDGEKNIGDDGYAKSPTGISSSAYEGSTGKAGDITVTAINNINLRYGGVITNDTWSRGNAGDISIHSKQLSIDGQEHSDTVFTGITSTNNLPTNSLAKGNAGKINIYVDDTVTLTAGGRIRSTTYSDGKAGIINLTANKLLIDGDAERNKDNNNYRVSSIRASARAKSTNGQVGDINIHTSETHLSDGGQISINNESTLKNANSVNMGKINIDTNVLTMDTESVITTASSGNIAASNVFIHANRWLNMQNAQITTSVTNEDGSGNGGNINIDTPVVLLDTGFIQANSIAKNGGDGGKISINSQALISSGNTLSLGGTEPLNFEANIFGLNVIQAAAPTGINGEIHITSPQLNLSGILANLSPANFEHHKLITDACNTNRESSLSKVGRGGLLPNASDVLGF